MYKEVGGAFMFSAIYTMGLIDFFQFLKSAIFVTGYISRK